MQANLGYFNILKGCGSKKCPFRNTILFSPAKGRKICWQVDICIFWNACSSSFQPLLHWAVTIIYVHGLGNRLHLSVISAMLPRLFSHAMLICSMFLVKGVVKLIFQLNTVSFPQQLCPFRNAFVDCSFLRGRNVLNRC